MSHFTVLVHVPASKFKEENIENIEKIVDEMLLPYHEFECTGIQKYIEKIDITDEYTNDYIEKTIPVIFNKETNEKLTTKYSEEAKHFMFDDDDLRPGFEIREIPANEYYSTFEEFLRDWHGFRFDGKYSSFEDGKVYKFTNPNAKWDWYSIGGRWSGMFLDFNGCTHDIIKKGYWDLEQIKANVIEEYLPYYEKYQASGIDELPFVEWSKIRETFDDIDEARTVYHNQEYVKRLAELFPGDYYLQRPDVFYKKTQEEFINEQYYGAIQTYAFLDETGWNERGEMGWFGMSYNETPDWTKIYLDKLNEIDDNDYLVLVDCHI